MSASEVVRPSDGLGDRSAARYGHFRGFVEAQDYEQLDQTLFGLLLGAENMRDEMRTYEEQQSSLVRLAQTGHFVRQLQRLNGVLDEASASYDVKELQELQGWKEALEDEREARMDRYDRMLAVLEHKSGQNDDGGGVKASAVSILSELESDEQQEEALTLLKSAIDNYADDVLTCHEAQTIKRAFALVAECSHVCVVSLPPWFVPAFDFGSTFGLSRWGNDLQISDHSDPTGFIKDADTWSSLNHPHVAKFLGASHVGSRKVIAHEKLRPLTEYVTKVKDRMMVWRRLHEVALGLQYLHERGLSCRRLTVDSLHCAQFEDKLVLLGSDLQRIIALPVRQARLQSDLLAFSVAILNVLHEADSPVDPADESAAQRNRFRSIPAERPGFVAEAEWGVVEQMSRSNTDPPRTLLRAMNRIQELAGIDHQHNGCNYAQSVGWEQAIVDGKCDVGQVIAYAADDLPVYEILSRCQGWSADVRFSSPVYARLADVYAQLCQQYERQSTLGTSKEVAAHFINLLARLYRHLKPRDSFGSLDDTLASVPVSASRKDPGTLLTLHVDIDRFLRQHALDVQSNAVHLWQPQWVERWADVQSKSLDTMNRVASVRVKRGRDADLYQQECAALLYHSVSKHQGSLFSTSQQRIVDANARLRYKFSRWFIPPSEVDSQPHASLGHGSFGSVHAGRWFDTPVVVKRVLSKSTEEDLAQFRHEADVWFRLNHINVVKMYGACDLGEPFFVCEYASGGDLDTYVKNVKRQGRQQNFQLYLIWYSLLNAALGLQYLHDNGVVHGDLKANNILVGADDVVKLADFGLSVSTRGGVSEAAGGAKGAYRWKAPEHIAGAPATFASDVYSFAMVMIEVLTGSAPWGSLPDLAVQSDVALGIIPPRPSDVEDPEWRLIQRMCCLEPMERVTIDTVVVHLNSLIDGSDRETWLPGASDHTQVKPYKNRVLARGGALMSLISLATSSNKRLSMLAADHLGAVHVNRGERSERREIDAIVSLLVNGSNAEEWAANVLWRLAWNNAANKTLIAAAGGIDPLVKMTRYGTDGQKLQAVSALFNLAADQRNKILIADAGGIPPLVALLSNNNWYMREKAAGALRNLAVNPQNKAVIAAAGAIPPLVALVRNEVGRQRENAAAVLNNLAKVEANRSLIVNAGGITPLVALARDGNVAEKDKAAGALWNLSSSPRTIGPIGAAGAIGPLVALLRHGDDGQKESAACALWNLSVSPSNVARIVRAGGIEHLVELVRHGTDVHKGCAAGALANLAGSNAANQVLIANAGAVTPLVALVRDGDDDQKEAAAGALTGLSIHPPIRPEIIRAGGVAPLISLVRGGTSGQRAKAKPALWNLRHGVAPRYFIFPVNRFVPVLIENVANGTDAQKRDAADAICYLRVDADTEDIFVDNGGFDALLALIRHAGDAGKEKGLLALENLCRYVGTRIRTSVIAANGVEILSELTRTGSTRQQELAGLVLAELEIAGDPNFVRYAA